MGNTVYRVFTKKIHVPIARAITSLSKFCKEEKKLSINGT